MSFSGRTAIVTGAASGIGAETARQLSARGARVLATDLAATGIEELGPELGANVEGLALDVTDREALRSAVERVVAEHGRLDYMFNNAGVAIFGEVESVSLDEWDKIIDVNLRGVAHGTTIAYEQMVRQGHGHIVNTASLAGLVPVALQAHYCATKHGVVGLCKTLAVEARGHGVGVTAFCPGFIETGMMVNNTLRGSMAGAVGSEIVPIPPHPVDKAVADLLAGVERGRLIVISPKRARVLWWLERAMPRVTLWGHRLSLRELRRRSKKSRSRSRASA
jgi:NAD(P)-dependent dehydrogenase (short-subunit alcohol dehydrogenase family)